MIEDTSRFGLEVKMLSRDKCVSLLNKYGKPSVFVKVPKMTNAELYDGGDANTHPAFIVNGVEKDYIYVGKNLAFVESDCAYSLPLRVPKATVTFDASVAYCLANNGSGASGFHLMTNAEWAALALRSKKRGIMPYGNNNYGADILEPTYKAEAATKETTGAYRTLSSLTGSGGEPYSDDRTLWGVDDLNGNLWDWNSGLRLNAGEINIITNNDAAMASTDHTAASAAWKAILEDGSLVAPGTDGTLKFNGVNPVTIVKTITATTSQSARLFAAIVKGADVASLPAILKTLAIAPADADQASYLGDGIWHNLATERSALRGGRWINGAVAGVFALYLTNARSNARTTVGFRPAYYVN
jgi:hypothetical protein